MVSRADSGNIDSDRIEDMRDALALTAQTKHHMDVLHARDEMWLAAQREALRRNRIADRVAAAIVIGFFLLFWGATFLAGYAVGRIH